MKRLLHLALAGSLMALACVAPGARALQRRRPLSEYTGEDSVTLNGDVQPGQGVSYQGWGTTIL
jgi:hypothetical protein